jgi:hypothetical protein
MNKPAWLPDIIPFSDFNSDLNQYLGHLYTIFKKDFIDSRPLYNGKPVLFAKKEVNNYPICFWHIITDHKVETCDRIDISNLSLLRCERICWIRPVIENSSHNTVSVWPNNRGKKFNTLFFVEDCDFLVVLTNVKDRFYLMSSYYINYPNRKRQLIQERDEFLQSKNRP